MRQSQSRLMSFAESAANVAVGFLITLIAQIAVYPVVGLTTSLAQNLAIAGTFTVISVLRGYMMRRFFEQVMR
jgi:hypothetical protein